MAQMRELSPEWWEKRCGSYQQERDKLNVLFRSLTRYSKMPDMRDGRNEMVKDDEGDWIKYEELEAIMKFFGEK